MTKKIRFILVSVLLFAFSANCWSQELVEKKLAGNWIGTYKNSTISANFTKNKILIRIDGRPKSGTFVLENNHRVILFELKNAVIDGTAINLTGMEISDKNKYLSLIINGDGSISIDGQRFTGRSVITYGDIAGLWMAESGDVLDIKADGYFRLTDAANDVFIGNSTVLQCYDMVIYNDAEETERYELVTGNDFIILSEIILQKE